MGMSLHVSGIRDLDGQFAKMLAVKEACEHAGVDYPPAVRQYFKYPEESAEYLRKEMSQIDIDAAVDKSRGESVFEVDLSKLSPEVKRIRFEASW